MVGGRRVLAAAISPELSMSKVTTLPEDVCLEEAWDVDDCAGGEDDGQQLVEAGGGVAEVPLPVLVRAAHSRASAQETLFCTVLYCTVLYCTVLYCTVM